MQSRSQPADRIGTVGVEAFDAAYGAGFDAEDESPHALDCELVEDGGSFAAHRPAVAARPRRVAFVDGTMRTEARLTYTGPQGDVSTGLAGSWAAGAVLVADDGLARFERVAVGRTAIFTGGGAIRLPAHRAGWQWEPHAVEGGDIEAARQQLRRLMRDAESTVAEELCGDGWLTVLDGPLYGIRRRRSLPLTSVLVLPHPERGATEVTRHRPDPATEATAMGVVMEHERVQDRRVEDVSTKNLGYDVTSLDPASGDLRPIEVKGLAAATGTISPDAERAPRCRGSPGLLLAVRGHRLRSDAGAERANPRPGSVAVARGDEGATLLPDRRRNRGRTRGEKTVKTHNLFISHSWSYADQYDRLVRLLQARTYFRFRDYSVPRNDPIHNAPTDVKLREAIRNQMAPCGVVLILAGVYASYSKWIDKEIALAENGFGQRKPIIAIEPWGSKRTSARVKAAADRTVKWYTESVVGAIRELS